MSQRPNHGSAPKGDVSYLRATPGPSFPIAPSPLPAVDNGPPVAVPSLQHNVNSDLEDKLELQQRELDEIRARAAQMEKTMRWWSDCTSNWREKWSKVRNERNKAREENRQLRAKLDMCVKDINTLKREKEELVTINNDLTKKLQDKQIELPIATVSTSTFLDSHTDIVGPKDNQSHELPLNIQQSPSYQSSSSRVDKNHLKESKHESDAMKVNTDVALSEDKVVDLEKKLDEFQKIILKEREEKTMLARTLDEVQNEVGNLKIRCEELRQSKHEAQLQIERLQDVHKDELGRLSTDLQDEQTSRSTMDRKLMELRTELEKLQKDNSEEWGKRERLESEKLLLERENKKLHVQISDLEEQLERKSTHASSIQNKDIKTLQMDVSVKNKELTDLKHVHSKLKKTFQERLTDLEHSKRRCEQFEMEVKKLRMRIDELKNELAAAEDEVDTQVNNVRKVQRSNDELQEQVENLQVQLEHVQTRLRRTGNSTSSIHTGRSFSPDLQALEIGDDTDDDFSEGT